MAATGNKNPALRRVMYSFLQPVRFFTRRLPTYPHSITRSMNDDFCQPE
jgi:hypothetical protein